MALTLTFSHQQNLLSRDIPSNIKDSQKRGVELEAMMHMGGDPNDPIGILLVASLVRDDMPWFYEIALEAYRAIKSGDTEAAEREIRRLRHLPEKFMHGPFMEEFGGKEMHMFMMEFPRVFENVLRRYLSNKKPTPRRRTVKASH